MPAETSIEWTESTWNPVTGCSKVSPGCAHCYAETLSLRFGRSAKHWLPQYAEENLVLHPDRLAQPRKWKRPRMIFVNSMSDLFHELIPLEYIRQVFEIMAETERHTFQVLTKRHERLAEIALELEWPPNVWVGVSIENDRWALRADYLRKVPAAVRFISAEPLLGPLDDLNLERIDWLIAGGESGPKHRPVRPEWLRSLRDRCSREGVPFFFKQWGGIRPQAGGRLLDGREWNEMPRVAHSANGHKHGGKVARQRDIADSADEKWFLKAHSEAKHNILHGYLGAWLAILGRATRGSRRIHHTLMLIDGFAGRGRYMGGEPGSPQIMHDRAVELVEAGLVEHVAIRCSEKDPTNYKHLKGVFAEIPKHDGVTVKVTEETFQEVAEGFLEWVKTQPRPTPPTFVFVDPFGISGVSLDLLRRLMEVERLEVFLTLMVRDPARFLTEENYAQPLTELFGGDRWRECIEAEDKPQCLMLKFREIVLDGVAEYALPYRVFEDERQTVLYYLVHLTNNDLGMREMKKNMMKRTGDMSFYPVTLRPPGQLALDVAEPAPFPSLQKWLSSTYAGQTMTFVELLNRDYANGAWLAPEYRAAVKAMENAEPPSVTIRRAEPLTKTGRPAKGLEEADRITFHAA
jgi:three-Cys-motif partner protein